MDELIRFVEMNQEPLVEIIPAMELSPEITEREVSYLKSDHGRVQHGKYRSLRKEAQRSTQIHR